ncbi:MAG: hypothetical protein ACFE94_11475 [Candidatus Hodarchaeota archaeon]
MSNSGLRKKNLELEKQVDRKDNNNLNLVEKYNQLKEENQNLLEERKILKELLVENVKKDHQVSLLEVDDLKDCHKNTFYFQIVLGILVIVLSLGFHILYLSITDCLLYSGGDQECWIKNWLGIDIHGSFFLDVMLYSLIVFQILLIILIIRNQLAKV